jgi:hypothetical protein
MLETGQHGFDSAAESALPGQGTEGGRIRMV